MTTPAPMMGLAPLRQRVREQLPVWFGFLGGALAWGVRLGGSYLLVPAACRTGQLWALHGLALVTLAVAIAAAVVGHRVMRDARRRREQAPAAVDIRERNEFMGLAACALSALFAGVIVLESTANFFIDPCLQAGVR